MAKINIKDKIDGKEIDLSLSELVEVPVKELASFTKVTHVDLSCNHLKSLPLSFCSLTHIIHLDLSKNQLTELPANFGTLRQLQYLDLYDNRLTALPISCCQLRNLCWLDLKNNPLNQKLKSIAGDCLDEKQCLQCAKKVIEYLKNVNSELERQKQKTLNEEREREAARKAEEELAARRLKEQKKAEKLRRKAERQGERRKEVQELSPNPGSTLAANGKDQDSKQNGCVPSQKKHAKFGSFFKWFVLLAIVFPLATLCGEVGYHVYSGRRIVSVAQFQQLVCNDWTVVRSKAFATWELVVSEEKRLLQLLMTKWKQYYPSTDAPQKEL